MENFDELALIWDNEPRRIERAKVVASRIIEEVPGLSQMKGLEYGCGTGLLSFSLQPHLKHITLADNSQGMLNVLKGKIEAANIDNMVPLFLDLSQRENIINEKFDIIYTSLTLHHIPAIDAVIESFSKMLNPSGCLCISDLDEEDGSFHGEGFVGHNGFNRYQLEDQLKKYGFDNIKWEICYQNEKKFKNGTKRMYPMFLMIGQKQI